MCFFWIDKPSLWSQCNLNVLPKYITIHNFNKTQFNNNNKKQLNYLQKINKLCNDKNLKHVIITHYCPFESRNESDFFSSLYYSNVDFLNSKMLNIGYMVILIKM